MDDPFEAIMSQVSAPVADLAREARRLIHDVMPAVVEVAWPRQQIIGFGIGPRKMSEQFAYVAVFKNRINLGFYYGADLPDPDGLLEGTGKLLRHIKVSEVEQLRSPAVRRLLEEASRYFPRLNQ